jgi:hypothetical protein
MCDRWWWEGDERWSWHGDLVQSIGVPVPVGRFASAEAIDSVLKEAGWELRDLVTESFPMVFSGADEWWAWGLVTRLSPDPREHGCRRAHALPDRMLPPTETARPADSRPARGESRLRHPLLTRNPGVGRGRPQLEASQVEVVEVVVPMRSPLSRRHRPTQHAIAAFDLAPRRSVLTTRQARSAGFGQSVRHIGGLVS